MAEPNQSGAVQGWTGVSFILCLFHWHLLSSRMAGNTNAGVGASHSRTTWTLRANPLQSVVCLHRKEIRHLTAYKQSANTYGPMRLIGKRRMSSAKPADG
ncbi:hypothetical protein J3F83DRAFT_739952 [Trichoderma novae-zelandiae]